MPRDSLRKTYLSEGIEVTFEPKICIHAARCVMGLPDVFRPEDRPWVHLQHASADEIANIILTCPTGALEFRRLDGGPEEEPDEHSTIEPRANGPLFVRGDLDIVDGGGNVVRHMTRAALCRCGGSENKPFCDGTHRRVGFRTT